jgi:hypothetical protein
MSKQIFRSHDLNGKSLSEVGSVELQSNAADPKHAVRLSQAEQIAADAVQSQLVADVGSVSSDTAFTSATMSGFLAGKQDNMEIEASSAAYLEIEDGYKIKVKQLLISDVEVDEIFGSLSTYISGMSPTKQEGDIIILNAAVDNQERSWIKNGSASQGVDGYTRLQTDYNVSSIRAMFSQGQYMSYSPSTGQFSVDLGITSTKLGAHNLPVNPNEFSTITGSTILEIAKQLESLVSTGQTTQQQATATVDSRISSCTGVSGSNLGNFSGRFSNDSTIKQVLQEAEVEIANSETANTTLRQDMNTADASLQANIDAANVARLSGDSATASASIARDNTLQSNIDTVDAALTSEAVSRLTADNALDARLDTLEASSTTAGSVAKAQADAQAFATASVSSEAAIRGAADAGLQLQIDAISAAFLYKGYVNAEGRIVHIDPFHANHNVLFESATLFNGDFYKVNADITITFGDSSSISVNTGDGLLAIQDVVSGSSSASDIHKTDNTEAADLIREGMLDGITIEKLGGQVKVVDDSIGRTQLAADVETDIDSKVEKAGDTMTGALKIDKTVIAGTGYVGGYDFAAHVKMKSIDTASLTDTQRGLLVENEVYTSGSGNPLDLDYANGATISSHYRGSSGDMTVAIVGLNGEGRVLNPSAKVYATGSYGVAIDTQLGVNAGGTFVAQNAATANLGVFAFSDTAGALNNRAAYFALSTDAVDFDAYRVARVASPLPVQDAAVIIDDYTGAKHALYVNGKSEFGGKVIVPASTADDEAINGSNIKAKQKIYEFDLVDGQPKEITTPVGMNLDKCMWRVVDNYTDVDLSVTLDSAASKITVLADGGSLTDVRLLLQELSCDVESV